MESERHLPNGIRIAISLLVVFATLLLTQLLEGALGGHVFFLLLGAVIFTALLSGVTPGIFAAILASAGHNFLREPRYKFTVPNGPDIIEPIAFLVLAVVLGWFAGAVRRAYNSAEQSRKEAEDAVRAREEILAIVAHDLKNPLSAVKMNAFLARRALETTPRSIEQATRATDKIRLLAGRMERLISDLLAFEKMRVGRLEVDLKSEELRSVLAEVNDTMAPLAQERNLGFFLGYHGEAWVLCDRMRLMQALINIIGNAIKFTAEGGRVDVSVNDTDEQVTIIVSDTGAGIRPELLPHIFDRHVQARETSRMGNGLGLSIAKSIVDAHSGSITVESRYGEGSRFAVVIPKSLGGHSFSRAKTASSAF